MKQGRISSVHTLKNQIAALKTVVVEQTAVKAAQSWKIIASFFDQQQPPLEGGFLFYGEGTISFSLHGRPFPLTLEENESIKIS
jgi:hypothetical protein